MQTLFEKCGRCHQSKIKHFMLEGGSWRWVCPTAIFANDCPMCRRNPCRCDAVFSPAGSIAIDAPRSVHLKGE